MAELFDLTSIIYLLIILGFFFGLAFGWLLGYLLRPDMKAWMMRRITGQNYVVVMLRSRGGQVKLFATKHDKPTITYHDKEFMPIESEVNYMGSVPVYVFDEVTVHAVSLKGSVPEKKFLEPSHLSAVFMLTKALYEKLANKKQEMLMWLCLIAIGVGVLTLITNYLTFNEVGSLRGQIGFVASQVNNLTQSANSLSNALG